MLMWRAAYLFVWSSLWMGVMPAQANIEIIPSILASHYWTDNRELTVDALSEKDSITEIKPEVTLILTSRRHRGELGASYQYLTYQRADETRNFQQYRASTNSELLSELLFLDLSADRVQSAVSQLGAVAANNRTLSTNRTDVSTVGIKPYLVKQWNPRWRSRIDYDYQDIKYKSTELTDSQVQEITALTEYGGRGDNISVNLSYSGVRVESDRVTTPTELDEIRLDTRYQMNSTWTWLLNAGYEEDRYERSTVEKTEGGFGEIGAEFLPTRKIVVSGTIGERYFGDTASLRLLYQYNSRTGVEASYRKDITQTSIELNRSGTLDETTPAAFDGLGNTFLVTEVFEIRRSNALFYYQWPRSRGELSGYREIRDFQLSLNQEIVDFVTASWNWSMTAKSSLDLAFSIRDRETVSLPGKDRLSYVSIKVETAPIRSVSMGGEYTITKREADIALSYREQQVGLFIRMLF
ncbi:hypothetical protein MNBD_GAMMA17-1995 [hydrothermal vent metagenome]|uniref:TIGR03016 family PEP-CTERM system-associated outer membrane protein n=1 Tax=hydrothermal vent metagenome TaxID=652676 RepID=A0A3B0ZT37_9ZZZZ